MGRVYLPQANRVHLIRGKRNQQQKQSLDSLPGVLTTHTNHQHLTAHHCQERRKHPTSFFFFPFKRPNMLSLDRFQSCFNSLKSETKSPFTSLTAGRFYVFLLLLPSSKGFIQLSHGSWESCECGAHQNTMVTIVLGPAGMGVLCQCTGVEEVITP